MEDVTKHSRWKVEAQQLIGKIRATAHCLVNAKSKRRVIAVVCTDDDSGVRLHSHVKSDVMAPVHGHDGASVCDSIREDDRVRSTQIGQTNLLNCQNVMAKSP